MELFTEKQLFNEIQAGNRECFEYLFFKYYEELGRYAFQIIRIKSEVEEIVQEVFIKLWEHRTVITIEISLKAYLYKAVHNQCLNFIDHQKVKDKYSAHYLLLNKDLVSPVSSDYPIANLLNREIDDIITKAILDLPDQCREVFTKVRYDELSYAETAELLGISVNTVKTQLQRAVSKLRDSLKEYLPIS
jgi:RNA polymerase sigma-70 factor (ECF subfamily)